MYFVHRNSALLALALSIALVALPAMAQEAISIGPPPPGDNSWFLLYAGDDRSEPSFNALAALPKTDELAESRIVFRRLQPASEEYAKFVNESGFSRDSLWALAVPDGNNRRRCLLQGTELPSAEDIQNALDRAGLKSPIRILKDFLRQHPYHLDARMELLNRLRPLAEERTRDALQLNIKTTAELTREERVMSFIPRKLILDTDSLGDSKLDSEQDLKIWGQYAQELRTLFSNDDWRLTSLYRPQYHIPLAGCSPMMIQAYRQNIPKIEAYLEEYPSDISLWQMLGYMASISGRYSSRTLLDRITPPPNTRWPVPEVLDFLLTEDQAKGNWAPIAETLMNYWPGLREYNRGLFYNRQDNDIFMEYVWNTEFKLLLESTIRTNRVGDAETVISDSAKDPRFRDIQLRAADLALSLGRQDLRTKWLAMQIPEKEGIDMDEIYRVLGQGPPTPRLVIISGKVSDRNQADELLRQSRIADWQVLRALLSSAQLEFLRVREAWPETDITWALFYKNNMLAHGQGLPTEESLVQELELSRVQTPADALRRFISEHPTQIEAKENLLVELKRVAELKTRNKLGAGAGRDLALKLSDEDDKAIWSEYASLFRQLLPFYLESGRSPGGRDNPCDSRFFIHSQTMEDLARSFLPQIEASIKRQPSDYFLWNVWAALYDLDEHQSFVELIESLEFQPLASQRDRLPPNNAIIVSRWRDRANWKGVVELQERVWEARQDVLELNSPGALNFLWFQATPLLEAYLHLDRDSDANEVIRIMSQLPIWPQIKQMAVNLAKRCGKDTVAEMWERKSP